MLLLTHLAGMRVGEVAALTWGDVVNADGRVKDEIRLNGDQTKGGHPRIVFLSPKLLKELEVFVGTAKQREAHWAFFATQKEPQRGFPPTHWPNTFCSFTGVQALMGHPVTVAVDHLPHH
jgi:integrase/recombinase XerD